jgi:hypothetical protein
MCKNIARKKLTKEMLWTFEWFKMSHIFISPYHNHFWVDFNIYFLKMYIIFLKNGYFSYGLFNSLTTG